MAETKRHNYIKRVNPMRLVLKKKKKRKNLSIMFTDFIK